MRVSQSSHTFTAAAHLLWNIHTGKKHFGGQTVNTAFNAGWLYGNLWEWTCLWSLKGSSEKRQLFRSKGCCLAVLGVCLRFDRLLDVWDLNIILVKEMDEVQHLHRVALLFPCRWRTSCIIVWRRQRVPLERAALRKTTRNTTHDALSASFMPCTDGCDSHQHLALSTPSSFCHGGLCHVTTINGWLKAGHVIQRTSQCDPHSCHTSSGQWEALPPLSSPQTFSAKRRQIEEQLGWEGWKPHRLQTQSECWLGASLEPVWWSESALQTSKLVCIQLKCSFHGGSDCRSSTGGAALTALDDKGQEL